MANMLLTLRMVNRIAMHLLARHAPRYDDDGMFAFSFTVELAPMALCMKVNEFMGEVIAPDLVKALYGGAWSVPEDGGLQATKSYSEVETAGGVTSRATPYYEIGTDKQRVRFEMQIG